MKALRRVWEHPGHVDQAIKETEDYLKHKSELIHGEEHASKEEEEE